MLDTDKLKGVIDLSLKHLLTQMAAAAGGGSGGSIGSSKKKSKHQQQQQQLPDVGAEARAAVLVIKEHYMVVAVLQQQQQQNGVAAEGKGKKSNKKAAKGGAAAAGERADTSDQQQQQQYVAIGFLARGDLNSQGSTAKDYLRFKHDQVVPVRVVAHPSDDNGRRLLLEVGCSPGVCFWGACVGGIRQGGEECDMRVCVCWGAAGERCKGLRTGGA